MTPFYKQGVAEALNALGLKCAMSPNDWLTPFPTKSKNIPAERLADLLQHEEDAPQGMVYTENGRSGKNPHVTWSHAINLSGLDEGQPVAGFMSPLSPRG